MCRNIRPPLRCLTTPLRCLTTDTSPAQCSCSSLAGKTSLTSRGSSRRCHRRARSGACCRCMGPWRPALRKRCGDRIHASLRSIAPSSLLPGVPARFLREAQNRGVDQPGRDVAHHRRRGGSIHLRLLLGNCTHAVCLTRFDGSRVGGGGHGAGEGKGLRQCFAHGVADGVAHLTGFCTAAGGPGGPRACRCCWAYARNLTRELFLDGVF